VERDDERTGLSQLAWERRVRSGTLALALKLSDRQPFSASVNFDAGIAGGYFYVFSVIGPISHQTPVVRLAAAQPNRAGRQFFGIKTMVSRQVRSHGLGGSRCLLVVRTSVKEKVIA